MRLIKDIWGNLPFQVRVMCVAGLGIMIILLVVLAQIGGCRDRRREQTIERTKDAIKTAGTEANVLTNQKIEVESNVQKANTNLGSVLGTDTGGRDGNFGAVRAKFCADHPDDSKCK